MIFIKEGNFPFLIRTVLSLAGAFVIAVALYFFEGWLFLLLACLGLGVGSVGMYAGQASILRLKPFTNDPLGWRKAKRSYEEAPNSQEPNTATGEKPPKS